MQAIKTNSIPAPKVSSRRKEVFVHVRVCDRLVRGMDQIVIREQCTRSDFLREAIEEKLRREAA